ncbi:MAG: alpha/beta hydrolase [Pseudomonadales bacterium]|nr:alpha/beta hydrolase [Pseudomonadales bacterium]
MSIRAAILRFVIRRTMKKQFANIGDVVAFRERMAASGNMMPDPPDNVSVVPVTAAGVPCEWITTDATDQNKVLVYLHGGGYVFGGPDSHRDVGWRLAEGARMRVLMVDYRLAPENPFPAAVEDATDCYRWLLDEGFKPSNIAIGGDSAGGGLTVATLVNLRNLGMPMPSAAILLSPWTDLSVSGDSVLQNADADPMLSRAALETMASHYLGDRDRRAPLASPLFADLRGLPPMLVQVGSTEVLLSDAERLTARVREAGGEAELEVWPNMPHVFQVFASRLPEGKQAIGKLSDFLVNRT